jgi:glycerol-3-phosphate dehydrogenase
VPDLFKPSLAWNILLNHPPLSDYALAVKSPGNGKHTYFIVPWKGKLLIGTGHASWLDDKIDSPVVSREHMEKFLYGVNQALPGLDAAKENIEHIFSGFLPVRNPGSTQLTTRGVILHHGDIGGPEGFYSVSGIKFTTARRMAQNFLDRIPLNNHRRNQKETQRTVEPLDTYDGFANLTTNYAATNYNYTWKEQVKKIVQEEAVMHLDDLIFRRSDAWEKADRALEIAPRICDLMGWDEYRRKRELQRLSALFNRVTSGS